jgi:hypothetical protein
VTAQDQLGDAGNERKYRRVGHQDGIDTGRGKGFG